METARVTWDEVEAILLQHPSISHFVFLWKTKPDISLRYCCMPRCLQVGTPLEVLVPIFLLRILGQYSTCFCFETIKKEHSYESVLGTM